MKRLSRIIFHPGVLIPVLLISFLGTALFAKIALWPTIKKFQARHYREEAVTLSEINQFSKAFLEIRKAIVKDPTDIDTYQIALDLVGKSPDHYQYIPVFLKHLMRLDPENPENFNKFILLAVRGQILDEASAAFENYPEKARNNKEFHQLGYSLGLGSNNPMMADYHLEQLLAMDPDNKNLALRLSSLRLQTSNDEDTLFGAKATLSNIVNEEGDSRLPALRALLTHSLIEEDGPKIQEFIDEMKSMESLQISDRLLILQARKFLEPINFNLEVEELLKSTYVNPRKVVLILDFLLKNGLIEKANLLIQGLNGEIKSAPLVKRKMAQVYYYSEDWPRLKDTILEENWGEYEYGRYLLLAYVSKIQKDPLVFAKYWQQCLIQTGSNRDNLKSLFQSTSTWGWNEETIEVLERSFFAEPDDNDNYHFLMNHFMRLGQTSRVLEILARRIEFLPEDRDGKNNFALLSLLTDSNQGRAFGFARENYEADPENAYFKTTWVYALVKQGRLQEAKRIIESFSKTEISDPQRAVYLAKVMLELGHEMMVHEFLNRVEMSSLFKEEQNLLEDIQRSMGSPKE